MTESTAVRPTKGIVVSAVIIAVLGVLIAWSAGRDDRPHASVGDTIKAGDVLANGRTSFVLLPTTRLDIVATGALEDVDRDVDVRAKQAPDDGSFVGLQVTARSSGEDGDIPDPANYRSAREDITLTLLADGRRYPLAPDDDDADDDTDATTPPVPVRTYVAVAGTPRRLLLEVGFRTRTQQVDLRTGRHLPGAFADLYRNRSRTVPCGAATLPAGVTPVRRAPTCRVTGLLRTPYYGTLQWAPAGKAWLVARVVTTAADGLRYRAPGGATAGYEVRTTGQSSYRFDGAAPAYAPPRRYLFGFDRTDTVVLAVPATRTADGQLTVTVTQKPLLRQDSRRSTARLPDEVDTTWQVRI